MANLELLKEISYRIGLPRFNVVNDAGEVINDSFAIIGFHDLEQIENQEKQLSDTVTGLTVTKVLFGQTPDFDMRCIGNLEEELKNLSGFKEFAYGDSTFDIAGKHFCPGILIRTAV